jgi:two-component system response regulator YesN
VNEDTKDKMEVILEYIEHRFTEDFSLDDLSELVFLSPTYVSHLFHQKTGSSIREFLNQRRIEYACNLLSDSNFSIKEIAEKCGYSNLTHFYRIFKKIMNITPLEFRKEEI